MVMALGGMEGLLGIPLPGVEIGIALSALVLGAMVLTEKRPPLWVAAVIVGGFAIFHGHAHGTEMPAGQSGLLYSMGFVIATGCVHGVGIGIGLIHRWARDETCSVWQVRRWRWPAYISSLDVSRAARAEVHLVTTGLGSVYDGILHLTLSQAGPAVVIAVTLLAAMRGHGKAVCCSRWRRRRDWWAG
jgi:hydrogenase/urease accessory protein HupE